MSFREPLVLVALGLLPLAVLAYVAAQQRRRRYAVRYTNVEILASVAKASPLRHLPALLALLAFAALLVALARPERTVAAKREEATVIMVTDTSGSMLAKDVLPDRLTAGRAAELNVEVLAASGRRVPNVEVALAVTGADVPARVNTGARGVATVAVTARDAVTLTARADLPADLPALYVPTRGESARNAQRIVAPATSAERVEVKAAVRAQPQLSTQISAQTTSPGAQVAASRQPGAR